MTGPARDDRGRFVRAFVPLPLGAEFAVCTQCGALVVDRAAHVEHHAAERRRSAMSAPRATLPLPEHTADDTVGRSE